LAGDTEIKRARHDAPGGAATSASFVSSDNVLLALAPVDAQLVIGQRGLADLLGDLAVATDDLSS
jgi:hypothetical protein